MQQLISLWHVAGCVLVCLAGRWLRDTAVRSRNVWRLIEINERPHSYWMFLHVSLYINLFTSHKFTLHFLSYCVTVFTIIWLRYLAPNGHIGPSILQQSISPVIWNYTLQICSNVYDEYLYTFFFYLLLFLLNWESGLRQINCLWMPWLYMDVFSDPLQAVTHLVIFMG